MEDTITKKIISQLIAKNVVTHDEVLRIKREILHSSGVEQPGNAKLIAAYREMIATKEIAPSKTLERLLQCAEIRSLSGISVLTVLTKPYPCPGKCVYCPTESIMPKSYLSNEPAAQRAFRNKFDPWMQIANRICMLEGNGHSVEKIELIVKGGTWNAYRYDYQLWFIRRCFEVCNTYAGGEMTAPPDDGRSVYQFSHIDPTTTFTDESSLEVIDAPSANTIDEIRASIEIEKKLLEEAQKKNETARYRIIGLTLETRPDWIRAEEIVRMRELGCTRVEVGLQHTSDEILSLIKRGHTVAQFKRGVKLLRDAGFKVDFHTMPQLPGSSPEIDLKMYRELFSDSDLRPDMLKIYPCSVVPMSELYEWYQRGEFTPYPDAGLFEMLIMAKQLVPRYCRISRLIRDIPSDSITAGNKVTNLREYIQKEMSIRGVKCVCLRCREYGRQLKLHTELHTTEPQLFVEEYEASGGTEFFISFEDPLQLAVYAFIRMRIGGTQDAKLVSLMPELSGAAFIRELHTYGHIVPIGEAAGETAAQHKGLGRRLMETAEKIARDRGAIKMLVISGVGVREYYGKLGYTHTGTYMGKCL